MQGGTRAKDGLTDAVLGRLEMRSGWCDREKHAHGVENILGDGVTNVIVPPSQPPTSVRFVRTLADRTGGGWSLHRHLGIRYVGG